MSDFDDRCVHRYDERKFNNKAEGCAVWTPSSRHLRRSAFPLHFIDDSNIGNSGTATAVCSGPWHVLAWHVLA